MTSSTNEFPPQNPTSDGTFVAGSLNTSDDSDSTGLKRKAVEPPAPGRQPRPAKKAKRTDSDSDEFADTHHTKVVTGAPATGRVTRSSGKLLSPIDSGVDTPVDDGLYSKNLPGNVDRATADERTRIRRAKAVEEKRQDQQEEARRRQELRMSERERMEAAFAETMREHEPIRRQGHMSFNNLMQPQPMQTKPRSPREKPFLNFAGAAMRGPRQLHHFATDDSKAATYDAETAEQQHDAEVARQQEEAAAAAGAILGLGNGESIRTTSKVKAKRVTFSEEVAIRTFYSKSASVAFSGEMEAAIPSDAHFDISSQNGATENVLNDAQADHPPKGAESEDNLGTTATNSANHQSRAPESQFVPLEDPAVVSAEALNAANIISGIRLTGQAEQLDGSQPGGTTAAKDNRLFEHDVVNTELEAKGVALLESHFGTVTPDSRHNPKQRLTNACMEDQLEKIEAFVLNGLGHGDLTEVFASNFLFSLTMRFYKGWTALTKDWHFWGDATSSEAVRLDLDLIKWIYLVLWTSTKADTFWHSTGVLHVRLDQAWTSSQNMNDTTDDNATEPDTETAEDPRTGASSINTHRDGIGEEKREKEWALRFSWLDWARGHELDQHYSDEDIHRQRTIWLMLVAKYSDLSRYGPHHAYTYKGRNAAADDDANNDDSRARSSEGRNNRSRIKSNGNNKSNSRDNSDADTDSDDEVELVTTKANYRASPATPATTVSPPLEPRGNRSSLRCGKP